LSQPYVGQITLFAGNFAPYGYATCDGQTLSISANEVLYNLIGTTYGGDGQSTFNLPDLRGRIPLHQGNSYGVGQLGGTETVTLTPAQLPAHNHVPAASTTPGNSPTPLGNCWAESAIDAYSSASPSVAMSVPAIGLTGGNGPHENRMPHLAILFVISLFGVYPSQG
jgi:microcystin-dependent protein